MKMRASMKSSKKVSSRISNKKYVSLSYAVRTKKYHLNIAMNESEHRLVVMNNQDAECHVASDLWSLGTTRSEKLCGTATIIPQLFLVEELEHMGAFVMYNLANFFFLIATLF